MGDRVADLTQVVRRDVRCHADRDPSGAVHQQVREPRGQHDGLLFVPVEVRNEVDRFRFDLAKQLHRHGREPRFRVVTDEPVRDERVIVGVDPHGVDRSDACVLDGRDLCVVVVAMDQGLDHAEDFGVSDVFQDLEPIALPTFDAIHVVPAKPVPIREAGRAFSPDVLRDERDVVRTHGCARLRNSVQLTPQALLLDPPEPDACRKQPRVPTVGDDDLPFARRVRRQAGDNSELQEQRLDATG